MWKGRFKEEMDRRVLEFSQSLDMDWRLLPWDVKGSLAHAGMLEHVGLITKEEFEIISEGLSRILEEFESGALEPKVELEDVHMNVEARLIELTGAAGAKLHTGRSRNDQVSVTMRLYLRDQVRVLAEALEELLDAVSGRARAHRDVVVPGYTHTQQAQPISMGHYWMAYAQAFLRDLERLAFAMRSMELSPLGSGALAGSTLPIDRHFTAEALGFVGPTCNSLDTVGQRDHFYDILSAMAMFAVHCSRMCEDLILYSTAEFGWVKLPDAFCTGSSMMPQKKNADVLELIRGKTGQQVGHLVDLLVNLKGLPMTYNRDLQEDKRGLFQAMDTMMGVLSVMPSMVGAIEVDEAKAVASFSDGLALATDVAELLVTKGVPFRDAHHKVGRLVAHCIAEGEPLNDLKRETVDKFIPELADVDLSEALTPHKAVENRKTFGGTGFDEVERQIRQVSQEKDSIMKAFE